MQLKRTLIILLFFIVNFSLSAQENTSGTLRGTVIDAIMQQPLAGANIVLEGTQIGAATDLEGAFHISSVPVGTYRAVVSYIGYEKKIIADVIIRPERITFLNTKLVPTELETIEVVVVGGYFDDKISKVTGLTNFSFEEIRRAPGSAGDISRILMNMPSVSKLNDQSNGLIVRGGNPFENAFYIDGIKVPNINHFPAQGSSGGPLSLLNVDFIREADFYTGGFNVNQGNSLSSAIDISLREGNRYEFDGQLDLNFTGFGGVFEGPLAGIGSWLVSARRSYLDILINALETGTSIAPRYEDYQWKLAFDLADNHSLSFIGLAGRDHSESDDETARENKMESFGTQEYMEVSTGFNWKALWNDNAYSVTTLSLSITDYNETYFQPNTGNLLLDNNSIERSYTLSNKNHFFFQHGGILEFGFEAFYINNSFSGLYGSYLNEHNIVLPETNFASSSNDLSFGTYLQYTIPLFSRLNITPGLRVNHYGFTENTTYDPRIGASLKLSEQITLRTAAGIYHQSLPRILLERNNPGKLSTPRAFHLVAGADYLITPSLRLSIEAYRKNYSRFPMDPLQPGFFIIDENIYDNAFYSQHETLESTGEAYTEGIEIILQKKPSAGFYGLASLSLFNAKYKGLDGTWRNRITNNNFTAGVEAGYKNASGWEFSFRWIYAGGPPYTPFDINKSMEEKTGIKDLNRINEARYPDYHSLNLRVEKRFYFQSSNLVAYISIWNAYNRENIASYFWNRYDNRRDTITQWSILPIFGLEYEF